MATHETDVCIIGAGIAGLTTGYLLTQAGKSVVILDDGPLVGHVGIRLAAIENTVDV